MNVSMNKLPDLTLKPSIGFEYSLEQLEEGQRRFLPFSSYSHGEFQCVGFKLGITRRGKEDSSHSQVIPTESFSVLASSLALQGGAKKIPPILKLFPRRVSVCWLQAWHYKEGQRRFLPFSSYSHGEFQCVG